MEHLLRAGTMRFSAGQYESVLFSIKEKERNGLKKEKIKLKKVKTSVSIMRKIRPGEVSDDFLLPLLVVVRARIRTHSPHWLSFFHSNMQTP